MLHFDRYYVVKSGDKITTSAFWNPRLKHLDARIAKVEDQKASLDAVIEEGRTVFRDKATDVLVPLISEVYEIANVGAMLWATSSTEHDPTVTGGKTFILPEGQRLRFAAPAYVAVYRMTSPQAAMLGEVVSYDKDTGELVVNVDRVSGAGYGGDWTITVSSPSDTAEAIAEVLAARAVIEAVGEAAGLARSQAVEAKDQTVTMRGEVQGLTNTNNTLAEQVTDDAAQVALDREAADGAAAAATGAAGESQTARNASQQAATTAGEKSTDAGNYAQAALTSKGGAEQALETVTALHGEVETYHEQAGGFKEAAEAAADRSETAETNINAAAANVSQVHLGGWPADPVVDLGGNPVVAGATYWNTTDNKIKVYDGASWVVSVVPVGSEVTSIFGRTGNIGAVLGDYSADKITVTAIAGVTGSTVQDFLASLKSLVDGKSAVGHGHSFASLSAKPNNLSGYGISDAYTQTQINGFLADKLDVAGFTANAIITKLKDVDGTGSGLDADTLRGLSIGVTGQAVFIASTQAAARSALGLGTAATQNATAFAAADHDHAIEDTTGLQAALDSKPAKTVAITGTGLASGGGDLSANRIINVPAASQAQAQAGTDNATVMTPLRAKEAISVLVPAADAVTAGKTRFATPSDAQTSVNIAVDPALLKQRIDEAIAALLDGAPGSIDTLNELAAALGDDPNFAATVTASIATKLNASAVSNYVLSNLLGVGDAGAFKTVLGLNNVSNTADANKPVSTPQQTALNSLQSTLQTAINGKAATVHMHTLADISDFSASIATTAEFFGNTADKVLTTDQVWAAGAEVALSGAADITPNMAAGINFVVSSINGNRSLLNATNKKVGQSGYIRIVQDATGGRTLSYGTDYKFASGKVPTLSTAANAEDILFYCVISSTRVLISLVPEIS